MRDYPGRRLRGRGATAVAVGRRRESLEWKTIADESVEASEERPGASVVAVGFDDLVLLDLVLLLQRVDAILTLDVGSARLLDVAVMGVNSVGDLLPVLLTEVSAIELQVTLAPSVDESEGGVLTPAVFPSGEGRRRRPRRSGGGGRRRSSREGVHEWRREIGGGEGGGCG